MRRNCRVVTGRCFGMQDGVVGDTGSWGSRRREEKGKRPKVQSMPG